MVSRPEVLIAELHGQALREVCQHSGRHFSGLSQAARALPLPSRMRKKLQRLDVAFAVVRHTTGPSCENFMAELRGVLGLAGGLTGLDVVVGEQHSYDKNQQNLDEKRFEASGGLPKKTVDSDGLHNNTRLDIVDEISEEPGSGVWTAVSEVEQYIGVREPPKRRQVRFLGPGDSTRGQPDFIPFRRSELYR